MIVLLIPTGKIDAGYSIRFESSVEEQAYHEQDLQLELNFININEQTNGDGFIRYVRMTAQ